MPEYLAPGVYVEEIEMGAKPIEGVSTSTAGFLGRTERGPTGPKLVTSFADYERKFGGFVDSSYLGYAVDGFFRNGGSRCYVARVVDVDVLDDDGFAETSLADDADDAVVDVRAVGPGRWGHNVVLLVDDASLYKEGENELFKLTVKYWSDADEVLRPADSEAPTDDEVTALAEADADVEEVYDNLSPDEASSDYYGDRLGGSNLVTATRRGAGRPATGTDSMPAVAFLDEPDAPSAPDVADYRGNRTKGNRTGLAAFEEIDDVSIVCAPDENDVTGLTEAVKTHCEGMEDRFAVLQAPENPDLDALMRDGVPGEAVSEYAAYYLPWVKIIDPATNSEKFVPPGGHVAGVFARIDTERGVHKAPANETLRGAQELKYAITKGEQDSLNPKGINCIRSFRGRGIRVWGARTTSGDPLWKYVNVRRLFNYIEESIDEGTQWVVFEPNDEKLWARVRQSVTNFLTTAWRDGALMGTTPEEAFFVRCDRSTMTDDDIANGRLVAVVGVAPVRPAEFVIFRIAQLTSSAEAA